MKKRMAVALALLAAPAGAADLRDFCADRPGKDTPACILDAGHIQLELGLADVSRQRDAAATEHDALFGDLLIRAGLTSRLEAQLSLPGYERLRDRDRDRATGATARTHGFGDIGASLRFSLANPDGSRTAAAIQPFVTAPAGKDALGAGGWAGGVIVPLSFDLGGGWAAALDPEIDVNPDSRSRGAHTAWTGVAGLSRQLAGGVTLASDIWTMRDSDPGAKTTQASADVSIAWVPANHSGLQFDAGLNLGLTHSTPDSEVYAGIARRF